MKSQKRIFKRNGFWMILSTVVYLPIYCQITQPKTGTTKHLMDVSVFNNTVVICGFSDYLVKSDDECKTFTHIARPWPANYYTRMVSVNNNTAFLLAYNSFQALLYKSTDGGNTWVQKLDTAGTFNQGIAFFDQKEGFIKQGKYLMRTNDGGDSWLPGHNFTYLGLDVIKTNGDSMICVGGFDINGGGFRLSKDRGHTWPYGFGEFGTIEMTDFFFLNKDTIFGISANGGFAKTTNGGLSWYSSSEPPITYAYGLYFKDALEGYMIGANSQTIGVVLKTTDLGKTWTVFNTGVKSMLRNMTVLNDSFALLNGGEGVLLRWNYKHAIFTGSGENSFDRAELKIFPNPAKTTIRFKHGQNSINQLHISIFSPLGQLIHSEKYAELPRSIDISQLPAGIYFLCVSSEQQEKTFKFVKE
jgi:photosystem II stability/assembly factor-like uncharacterized protein